MTDEIIAMILSLVAMCINFVSFQIKNKSPLLLAQSIASILFLFSYVFLGGGIAVYLNIIFLIRNTIYMFATSISNKTNNIIRLTLISSYFITYILFISFSTISLDEKLLSILPVFASTFGTIAASMKNVNMYRVWKYGDSFSWIFYNLSFGIGAIGGVIGEIFNQISLTVGIIRYRTKDNEN